MGNVSSEVSDGIFTVRISGKLNFAEYKETQQQVATRLEEQNGSSILILAEGFDGWESEGDWGDLSFQIENDSKMGRMAVVCEDRWLDNLMVFTGQGIRSFPIRFFSPNEVQSARTWLNEES
jgi:stage II sporulation SpoAA-like protein